MTTKELLETTEISFFGKSRMSKPYKRITLAKWIKDYQSHYKDAVLACRSLYGSDKYQEMKKNNLPSVTISGLFDEQRIISKLTKQNPIIVIDIDGKDNPNITDWEEAKKHVLEPKGAFLSSLSVSGKGIYVFIYYDMTKPFLDVFRALKHQYYEMGYDIDNSCKDLTRLRFISYDENMIGKTGDIRPFDTVIEKDTIININSFTTTHITDGDTFIYIALLNLIRECGYRANKYDEWLQDAFRLAGWNKKLGFFIFKELSEVSDNYDEDAMCNKWINACETTRYDKDNIVYYYGQLKKHYGEYVWKDKINEYKEELKKQLESN